MAKESKKKNLNLQNEIARDLAVAIDMGYLQGTSTCFDQDEIETWGQQAIEAQSFFLSLAHSLVNKIRLYDAINKR